MVCVRARTCVCECVYTCVCADLCVMCVCWMKVTLFVLNAGNNPWCVGAWCVCVCVCVRVCVCDPWSVVRTRTLARSCRCSST